MVMYIMAASSEINTDGYDKLVSFNRSEVMERLGTEATPEDAIKFRGLWWEKFADAPESAPTFTSQQELNAAWKDVRSKL